MIRKEYFVQIPYNKGFKKPEEAVRKFLLKGSNTVRLTRVNWSVSLFGFLTAVNRKFGKQFGNDNDPKFISFRDKIQKDFIRKAVNNKKYANIQQGKQKWEHYFYRLSNDMKALFNKETLFFNPLLSASSPNFYGFEDPTFYRKDKIIGYVISHERMVVLYLTEQEKKLLEKQGVFFCNYNIKR